MESPREALNRTLATLQHEAVNRGQSLRAGVFRQAAELTDELFRDRPVGEAVAVATRRYQGMQARALWEDERLAWGRVVMEVATILDPPE